MGILRPAVLLIALGGSVILAQQPAARNPFSGNRIGDRRRDSEPTNRHVRPVTHRADRATAVLRSTPARLRAAQRRRSLPHDSRGNLRHADAAVSRALGRSGLAGDLARSKSLCFERRGRRDSVRRSSGGRGIVFGKAGCAGCHQVNGKGGVTGPDLSTTGRNPASALRQKILDPAVPIAGAGRGAQPAPGRGGPGARPQVIVVTTRDGREVRGVRRNEDTFSVQIVDAFGTLHMFDKLQLASVRAEKRVADAGRLPNAADDGRDRQRGGLSREPARARALHRGYFVAARPASR